MITADDLSKRFPYMFSGRNIGLSVGDGWMDLFAKLCEDIDALLGDDKRGFHWVQLKEKFGTARFYYGQELGDDAVFSEIADLVNAAEQMTHTMCMQCGQPGKPNVKYGWVLTLCETHAAERHASK